MSGSFPHLAPDVPAGCVRPASSPTLGAPHRLVIDGVPEQVCFRALALASCVKVIAGPVR